MSAAAVSATPADAAAAAAQTVEANLTAADPSSNSNRAKTKNQRKKANRKAKKQAHNALVNDILSQCNALTSKELFSASWFKPFERYKQVYRVHYCHSADLSADSLEWIYLLTKLNMQQMYNKTPGWGWKEKEKRAECTHPDARYFIITRVDEAAAAAEPSSNSSSSLVGEPIAFCHIRFTKGDMDDAPIAYVYELQLESSVQRQGLGKFLMSLVELVAWKCQLLRVVLTVFTCNNAARKFYTQTLNYALDESDPSFFDQEVEYEILAKKHKKINAIEQIVLPIYPGPNPAPAVAPASATTSSSAQ